MSISWTVELWQLQFELEKVLYSLKYEIGFWMNEKLVNDSKLTLLDQISRVVVQTKQIDFPLRWYEYRSSFPTSLCDWAHLVSIHLLYNSYFKLHSKNWFLNRRGCNIVGIKTSKITNDKYFYYLMLHLIIRDFITVHWSISRFHVINPFPSRPHCSTDY